MKSLPDTRILKQSLRANKRHGVIYLNNPKAGCSTIKASLLKAMRPKHPVGNVHSLEKSPFNNRIKNPDWVNHAFVFTFVRNPFVRIVSSYQNKIAGRQDNIWQLFARQHGLDPNAPLGFDSFVECIAADPPYKHDPHWRAQTLTTLAGYVEPNFLGTLENMNEQLPRALARAFPGRDTALVTRNKHGTDAVSKTLPYLQDKGTVARLHTLYGEDFERFGYPLDFSAGIASTRDADIREHDHPGFCEVLRAVVASTQT